MPLPPSGGKQEQRNRTGHMIFSFIGGGPSGLRRYALTQLNLWVDKK
ncbi:MAG: hypothetical protein H0W88_09745 [Parachlamydiaceae bacterium]|nr:hypothetical protein [Parachlamydiaceae bacterium]